MLLTSFVEIKFSIFLFLSRILLLRLGWSNRTFCDANKQDKSRRGDVEGERERESVMETFHSGIHAEMREFFLFFAVTVQRGRWWYAGQS